MTESNFVSEADFEKLLNSLPIQTTGNTKFTKYDWQAYFTTLFSTATRPLELLNVMPEHFNLKRRIIILPRTKTGFEKCKCSEWKKTKLISVNKDCTKCQGLGKFRIIQKTTILPKDIPFLERYLAGKEIGKLVWPITRQQVWRVFKEMCVNAGLEYFWEKKKSSFETGWPYLLRSSRSKIMQKMGASRELRNVKLRHSFRDAQDAYDAVTIQELLQWEAEHYPLITA